MDHDHDHNHEGGSTDDGSRSCPMQHTFHAGHCEKILWKGWLAYTVTEFVFSAFAIFFVAFAYEGLKFFREYYLRKEMKKESERIAALQSKNTDVKEGSCSEGPPKVVGKKTWNEKMLSRSHFIQTLLNFIQVVLSYLLMLIFMTFNYWLCLALCLGLSIGYLCFGWIKREVYDSECCH